MPYQIDLLIQQKTYQELKQITKSLNNGEKQDLAKQLGTIFTEISCQVLDQVFGELLEEQRSNNHLDANGQKKLKEAEQVFDQIESALKKYMPWSISFFSNDRLKPVANYMLEKFEDSDASQVIMYYKLERSLGEESAKNLQKLLDGDTSILAITIKNLITIIDLGVSEFIRDPKNLLKFNFVVNKTLDGVINMVTSSGYKRLDKAAEEYNPNHVEKAQYYAQHFKKFLVEA
ncbi:hypothetical protein [Acinetobacter rongchengensis]|uniref:Uncharacterized protein n=1 Tax=Acinetobacter rongchengensis TaxID=2419601 RepID=A0A3A8FD16_9GAMM|nr:hypothetical protein [Acinetobacter rongchengensis]RKG39051.1 hypothetical protein D7V20_05715 [Acinetobacter rongchengensis]